MRPFVRLLWSYLLVRVACSLLASNRVVDCRCSAAVQGRTKVWAVIRLSSTLPRAADWPGRTTVHCTSISSCVAAGRTGPPTDRQLGRSLTSSPTPPRHVTVTSRTWRHHHPGRCVQTPIWIMSNRIARYHDSSLKRSGIACVKDGSHSFICYPHDYPQWAIPVCNAYRIHASFGDYRL